ncbi:hypothetical protein Tco_0965157 [Tanacetum coccineum]
MLILLKTSSEGSDGENDSDDKNTQSDNEKGRISKLETDENDRIRVLIIRENEDEMKKRGADDETIQKEVTNAELTNIQQGNENPEISQVIEDAHVTLSTVPQKTEVPVTSSSHSFDLASKFLNFLDIPHTDAEIVSPMDVHVRHKVPSQQTPTLLTVPASVITDSSPVYSTIIPQSLPSFTPPPQQSISTPPPTIEATNPQSALPDFASDDPLKTQVTALVDEHLDTILGATKDEFMSYLSAFITTRITEQVKIQLPQILLKESAQAEEPVFETADTEMPKDQGDDMGNTKDQPNVEAASKHDCQIAKAEKPPLSFDELMSTPIDFSAFVMNHLKIDNLTQQHLVGPTFNLLKGTCKSRVELEYHFEECYKAVTDRLDWTNPEGHQYPFDLSKPLPLIEVQGRQVVPADYFINNDLEYLKGGSLSRKYTTSTTKTKAAKYDTIEGIEDMVQTLWSPVKVAYDKYALWGISH